MSSEDTFLSHLLELRQRLVRVIAAFVLVCVCLLPWAREIYSLLARPLLAALPQGGHMIAIDVIGPFLVPLKVTLLVAFVLVLPYLLHEAWAFVAPGLYAHEKRLVLPLIVSSFVLFLVGMSFAYFLVFPLVFRFMAAIAPQGVDWMTDIDKYFSFVLTIFIAFGTTFQVPVVVFMLVRTGLVSVETFSRARPYVIVGAFVVGAVLTPPDVLSQTMLATPLWLLFELGLILARFAGKSDAARDSKDAAEDKGDGSDLGRTDPEQG